jgi:hypothetical protein
LSIPLAEPSTRLLWCLRRRRADVRCILHAQGLPIEVQILQDRDVVLTEIFPEEQLAIGWARAYAERLKEQGWRETPATN